MKTFEAITTRNSCRVFTDKPVTEELTERLILAANAAPAASHDYSVIKLTVVQNKELLTEIDSATAHGLPPLGDHPTFNAPTLMIISVKLNDKFPMVGYCNASVAAENIMIMANDLGLSSVFLMGVPVVMQKKAELLEKLNIKDGFLPVVVVAVGYAKTPNPNVKPQRLKVERF